MAAHIGIVAVSSEGAALCYQTICSEAGARMGAHRHPEISMHAFPLDESKDIRRIKLLHHHVLAARQRE